MMSMLNLLGNFLRVVSIRVEKLLLSAISNWEAKNEGKKG